MSGMAFHCVIAAKTDVIRLEDLEDILSEAQPAVGAPPGVSLPTATPAHVDINTLIGHPLLSSACQQTTDAVQAANQQQQDGQAWISARDGSAAVAAADNQVQSLPLSAAEASAQSFPTTPTATTTSPRGDGKAADGGVNNVARSHSNTPNVAQSAHSPCSVESLSVEHQGSISPPAASSRSGSMWLTSLPDLLSPPATLLSQLPHIPAMNLLPRQIGSYEVSLIAASAVGAAAGGAVAGPLGVMLGKSFAMCAYGNQQGFVNLAT